MIVSLSRDRGLALISDVMQAHGGLDTWRGFKRVITSLRFGGWAFRAKCNSKGRTERRFVISLDSPMVVVEDYPRLGQQGIYTPDLVWIERFDGTKLRQRKTPGRTIRRWPHRLRWDDLDLLYFAGYACWHYFNTPFLFAQDGFDFEIQADIEMEGEVMRRVVVSFPDTWPSHSKKQTYYINAKNRIHRLDYNPTAFATWARAAHFCSDYQWVQGICLPTRRTVVPRQKDGRIAARPTLVWIDIRDVHFQ